MSTSWSCPSSIEWCSSGGKQWLCLRAAWFLGKAMPSDWHMERKKASGEINPLAKSPKKANYLTVEDNLVVQEDEKDWKRRFAGITPTGKTCNYSAKKWWGK
eukprot:g9520.t1